MDTDFSNYKLVDLGQGHYRLIPTGDHIGGDVHPVFGAVDSPESPKTVEDTFQRGLGMGAASR